MKNLLFILFFLFLHSILLGQGTYKDVVVTRDVNDIKKLKKVGDISESSSAPFGGQAKLREKAIDKAKKSTFEKGGNTLLIEVDNFAMTPLNNVNIEGKAYYDKSLNIKNINPNTSNNSITENSDEASCEDIRKELKAYKAKYGELRKSKN